MATLVALLAHTLTKKSWVSVQAAKANSACLIGRVARVGEGHRLAAKRRAWFRREEERRDSRRAHWAVNVVGRGVFRGRGNFVGLVKRNQWSNRYFQVSGQRIYTCVCELKEETHDPTLVLLYYIIYLLYNLVLQLISNYLLYYNFLSNKCWI